MKRICLLLISACLNCGLFAISALAQGTVFTYQGRLDEAGYPVTGIYDFRFRLASDPLGTNYLGGASVATNVPVANGLFTVALDFGGGIFNGNSYWLGVEVRTNGAEAFAPLSSLQALTPSPYTT